MMWRVEFSDGSALYLAAATEWDASFRARLMAWTVSGQWWEVKSVTKGAVE
jgi:hypothetical protein